MTTQIRLWVSLDGGNRFGILTSMFTMCTRIAVRITDVRQGRTCRNTGHVSHQKKL